MGANLCVIILCNPFARSHIGKEEPTIVYIVRPMAQGTVCPAAPRPTKGTASHRLTPPHACKTDPPGNYVLLVHLITCVQVLENGIMSQQADVFSFGVLLWEMLVSCGEQLQAHEGALLWTSNPLPSSAPLPPHSHHQPTCSSSPPRG